MIFVVTVGGQTVRIFADNAAQARERITSRFPGEPVTLVREGGRSGDANFRLISPTSFDPQGNPVYAPVGTPPPDDGGSGGGGGQDGSTLIDVPDVGTPAVSLELQTPQGAFNRFLGGTAGLGINDPRSAARTFARGQFDPNLSAFLGSQLGGSIGGEVFDPEVSLQDRPGFGDEFASFLRSGGGGFNPRQRLADAFRSVSAPRSTSPGPETFLGRALNPQTASEAQLIGQLGQNLQRSSVSPLLSRFFNPVGNEELFADFRGGSPVGGNFADFIRGRFGLGQLGF